MDRPEDQAYFSVTSLLDMQELERMPAQMIFGKRKAQLSVGDNSHRIGFVDNASTCGLVGSLMQDH